MIRCGCFLLGHKKSSHGGRTGPKRLAAISCGPRLMERGHQRRKGFNREEHLGVQDEYDTIRYVQVVTWNDGFPDLLLWCWSWWDWFWDVFDVVVWFNYGQLWVDCFKHRKTDSSQKSRHVGRFFSSQRHIQQQLPLFGNLYSTGALAFMRLQVQLTSNWTHGVSQRSNYSRFGRPPN